MEANTNNTVDPVVEEAARLFSDYAEDYRRACAKSEAVGHLRRPPLPVGAVQAAADAGLTVIQAGEVLGVPKDNVANVALRNGITLVSRDNVLPTGMRKAERIERVRELVIEAYKATIADSPRHVPSYTEVARNSAGLSKTTVGRYWPTDEERRAYQDEAFRNSLFPSLPKSVVSTPSIDAYDVLVKIEPDEVDPVTSAYDELAIKLCNARTKAYPRTVVSAIPLEVEADMLNDRLIEAQSKLAAYEGECSTAPRDEIEAKAEHLARLVYGFALVPGTYLNAEGRNVCDEVSSAGTNGRPLIRRWRAHVAEMRKTLEAIDTIGI